MSKSNFQKLSPAIAGGANSLEAQYNAITGGANLSGYVAQYDGPFPSTGANPLGSYYAGSSNTAPSAAPANSPAPAAPYSYLGTIYNDMNTGVSVGGDFGLLGGAVVGGVIGGASGGPLGVAVGAIGTGVTVGGVGAALGGLGGFAVGVGQDIYHAL